MPAAAEPPRSPAMDKLVEEYKEKQRSLQVNYDSRRQLLIQQEENTTVQREFAILEPDGIVYKLIGPVLVKQNLDDAKANVDKRLDYITGELTRAEKVIVDMEKELEAKKNALQDLVKEQQE